MPNWCSTSITFFTVENSNEALQQLLKLNAVFKELESGPSRVENGFGPLWLGNFIDYFAKDWNKFECKGYVCCYDEIDEKYDHFHIEQEDAWSPKTEFWDAILEDHFPLLGYVYIAEEPGCGVFINTDGSGEYYSTRYRVAYDGDEWEEEYYDSEEELLDDFEQRFGVRYKSLKALQTAISNQDMNVYISEFEDE